MAHPSIKAILQLRPKITRVALMEGFYFSIGTTDPCQTKGQTAFKTTTGVARLANSEVNVRELL